ncbi:hypothetical protein NG798_19490 [Ancylothrix sp. C2]|uniref:hypothetical protein n=1 Tax=Ancylothrix sp. D3o TaxID=2953691 RepID=UPI0021BA8F93|nr:hypothetical protein [Ancylothrix sp. D3o]MCT7951986.1 hypothetical protein [Ancylothrix sp. D3o]
MKLNPTVALTFVLLILMFGAGMVSGNWGYALGREALKGITQPDVRPTNNIGSRKGTPSGREEMVILKEADILKKVDAITSGKGAKPEKNEQKSEGKETPKSKEGNESAQENEGNFPLTAQQGGITLSVAEVKSSDDSVTLNLSLKNESSSSVRFLYSLLEVKDEQGQVLNATTEGLPGELPANGEAFSGTVKIPSSLVQKAKKLSLKLTDYPAQQLQLEVAAIPIGDG